ncbi:MAG: 4Fe-4S binding protein [Candidatus Thorarchaeota archaeon]
MIAVRKGKTKITIDYSKCGPDGVIDPRECTKCLKQCDRPVFHLHHVIVDGDDPWDPSYWQVTPVYTSQCTRCMRCIEVCPVNAISVMLVGRLKEQTRFNFFLSDLKHTTKGISHFEISRQGVRNSCIQGQLRCY